MLTFKRTNLFEATSQTLVNTVNCVGVMGKGIAKEFRSRDPMMYNAYKSLCDQRKLEPGKLWLWRGSEQWVLNFPTKKHWKAPSRLEWIEAGLDKFTQIYEEQGISEIAFPKLGCGNGNLEWDQVRPLMEKYLSDLSIPVFVHDFECHIGIPEHLEHLASEIAKSGSDFSFPGFTSALERIAKLSPQLKLVNDTEFELNFENQALVIGDGQNKWRLEEDDLRGVWLSLINGIVTQDEAGWAAKGAAEPLLTLMQILPIVRGIEIQKFGKSRPEIAVELRPELLASLDANLDGMQTEFKLH